MWDYDIGKSNDYIGKGLADLITTEINTVKMDDALLLRPIVMK